MSITMFIASAIVSVVVIAVAMRKAFAYAERQARDRKLSTEELQLKAEGELRKDVMQAILGVVILLTFIATAANVIQGFKKIESDQAQSNRSFDLEISKLAADLKTPRDKLALEQKRIDNERRSAEEKLVQEQHKIDDDQYARLLADLGSDSRTRQIESLNRLLARWQHDGNAGIVDHLRVIVTFLRVNAPMPVKLTPDFKYSQFPSVERSRPHIQAGVDVLSALNSIKRSSPDRAVPIVMRDVDLRDLSFQGRCLEGLDLGGCIMGDSDFTGCNMQELNAHGAFFEDAILTGAHLERSHLAGIRVTAKTNFSGAFVEASNLNDAAIDDYNGTAVTVLVTEQPLIGEYVGNPKWSFKVVPPVPQTRPTGGR